MLDSDYFLPCANSIVGKGDYYFNLINKKINGI